MKNFLQFENRKREYKLRSCVLAVEVAMKKVKDRRTKGRKLKHHLKKYYDEVDGAYYTENDDDDYVEDDYQNSEENDRETEKAKP